MDTMHQYIDGTRCEGSSGCTQDVIDPSTGETIVTVTLASSDDVDRAVDAARRAFGSWSRTTPAERSTLLLRVADILHGRADELAAVESRQCGKPIRLAREFDVPGSIDNIEFFAGAARILEGKATGEYSPSHTSSIRREPLGVVGAVAPWNYPLQMAVWKIFPAIAAGNTVVLKPAEITPLTALLLAEAITEAGVPDGVVNIVVGSGVEAGSALARHVGVDMISFTGSTAVGRSILEGAATNAKRVHLELGGKAPFVVFDDADLEAAIHGAVAASLINGGQDCTAATRAIVHESVIDAFVAGVAELYESVTLGPTADDATDMGPLSSCAHRDRVAGMVERARDYATIVTGGSAGDGPLAGGAYYRPTLVTGAPVDSEIYRDEVFGPVLTVTPFRDDDEAIALANDTPYGLAASAWTTDLHRALRATREIAAGCVWVNDHIPIVSEMPHGGVKQSGFGKDMSTYSFEEYTTVKHVMFDLSRDSRKEWHRTVFRVD